ncbi:hypothetical protein WKV44_10535, partial [Spirochaetia bacterium 38H-sp]
SLPKPAVLYRSLSIRSVHIIYRQIPLYARLKPVLLIPLITPLPYFPSLKTVLNSITQSFNTLLQKF